MDDTLFLLSNSKPQRMKLHQLLLTIILLFAGVSCEVSHYKAVNATYKDGLITSYKMVEEPLLQMGGTRTTTRSDGSSTTNDYQASFQHFTQAMVGSVASWSSASVSKAQLLFQRYQEGQITQRQAQAGLFELQKAELMNSGQPVEPGGSVLNNGKILTAPVP